MTRQPVYEAHILPLKAQHLSQRAPTALGAHSHPRGLLVVPSVSLEQWLPHWAWQLAKSARLESLLCPWALFRAKTAPWERRAYLAASRRQTATWTVTALPRPF